MMNYYYNLNSIHYYMKNYMTSLNSCLNHHFPLGQLHQVVRHHPFHMIQPLKALALRLRLEEYSLLFF